MHRATLASNTAATGGAVAMTSGSLTLENATISGNSSTPTAGAAVVGISGAGGDLTLNYSTISNNDAGVVQTNSGTITTAASLFADNAGGNCSGTVSSNGHNVDAGTTCAFAGAGDVVNAGAMLGSTPATLGALAANGGAISGLHTHALLASNPAISLVPSGCPATDEIGTTRPATDCSAGAFQYVAPSPSPATTTTAAGTTTASAATTTGAATGAAAPNAESAPPPPRAVSGALPLTGADEAGELQLASLAIALGAGMIGASRRRRAARV
jgi:hypothetical protein